MGQTDRSGQTDQKAVSAVPMVHSDLTVHSGHWVQMVQTVRSGQMGQTDQKAVSADRLGQMVHWVHSGQTDR
jgi:hypothetical protein